MINRLFVYGTLAPGEPNEHVMSNIHGQWQAATVRGVLLKKGWGATLGYPAIILDSSKAEVKGLVFSSNELADHWQRLDYFEGDGYRRVITSAELEDGTVVETYIYELNKNEQT